MSVAWTTIIIIALLLPGIFFFIGLAFYERLSREVVRSGVVSEVALAITIAMILHLASLTCLWLLGFDLSAFLAPIVNYDRLLPSVLLPRIVERLGPTVVYVLATAAIGFGIGWLVAKCIVAGPLRFLATHKWIYDIVDSDRKGRVVTAYVMTKTAENSRTLMYRGRVHEFFLSPDGRLSYITLKNCTKFFMTFNDTPQTTDQLELFDGQDHAATWDYLFIEGDNIANVLFDPGSSAIRATEAGREKLIAAIEELIKRQRTRTNVPRRPRRKA